METKNKGDVLIDCYVFDELLGGISNPSASLIYLYLWRESLGFSLKSAFKSHAEIGKSLSLSKSTVQTGIRLLNEKGLLKSIQHKASTKPEHEILRLWLKVPKEYKDSKKEHKKALKLSKPKGKRGEAANNKPPKKERIDPRSLPYLEKQKRHEQVFMDKLSPKEQLAWISDFKKRMGFDKTTIDEETLRKLAIEKWMSLLPK